MHLKYFFMKALHPVVSADMCGSAASLAGGRCGGTCGNVIFSLATPSLVLGCKQWRSLHPTANYPVGRLTYFVVSIALVVMPDEIVYANSVLTGRHSVVLIKAICLF